MAKAAVIASRPEDGSAVVAGRGYLPFSKVGSLLPCMRSSLSRNFDFFTVAACGFRLVCIGYPGMPCLSCGPFDALVQEYFQGKSTLPSRSDPKAGTHACPSLVAEYFESTRQVQYNRTRPGQVGAQLCPDFGYHWSRLAVRPPGWVFEKRHLNTRQSRVTAPADLEPPERWGLGFGFGPGIGLVWADVQD